MRAKLTALIATALLAGCTPAALKQHSVSLAGAGSDVRYRETIENLAMICANRWALPAYSSIYSGAMDVTDSVAGSETTTWIHSSAVPSGFSSQALSIPASRSVKGTLTLDPMIVPEKLRALRAACQWAISGEESGIEDMQILTTFKLGSPAGNYFDVADELREICSPPSPPWLGKGCCPQDVPRNACYCANCGRCFVWVCPEGMEQFSHFVLVCQRIARFDTSTLWKPYIGTKTVKWSSKDLASSQIQSVTAYFDQYGNLAITQSLPAAPPKRRYDNVGTNSDLRAAINSVIKSP
jgi:hypothetical protein